VVVSLALSFERVRKEAATRLAGLTLQQFLRQEKRFADWVSSRQAAFYLPTISVADLVVLASTWMLDLDRVG